MTTTDTRIELGDITADVIFKDIKNIHLSVYPPDGRVRIAAPCRLDLDTVRAFAISKLGWIKRQQRRLREQQRETPRAYLERESHFVWGRRYLLTIVEGNHPSSVALEPRRLVLRIRASTSAEKRRDLLESWYRAQLKQALPPIIASWESRLGVSVNGFYIQRMRTRWGSCNVNAATIRLNTELAKKPPECLEYVVVHELCHLLEPTHSAHFQALMDHFLPQWHAIRQTLNQFPLSHEDWTY